ncbi:MAG: 4Fe-4S binding protein [Anaerolineaceae bacterium]|jgi:ferredoxin|nr:4Fe-4S binding protein [Anaerolineaceae bacterium]MDD4042182.1 4Fe-4S binding protein [Anaerolineaceae bacterium]MDD4577018.1 4Fe-4S binding protein [Anaerolineaceae bacterium]
MSRGTPKKTRNEHLMTINRDMMTRNYSMKWDLDKCVGCQIGPTVCPKDALTHVPAVLENGHILQRASVDVDENKCINCGICVEACPTHAIELTVNGKPENPVIEYGAFPKFDAKTIFHRDQFDFSLKDFIIENCPTNVISYDEKRDTMRVVFEDCIHCRQCEVASKGAFEIRQPWVGSVVLEREKCIPDCFACADICPTRALHVNDEGELVLADYYCIKCGACMQVCPVKPEYEEVSFTFESQGMTLTRSKQELVNEAALPIVVERWRIRHSEVSSAAWIEALRKLSDDKAKSVEIDRKRALRRADLIEALRGNIVSKSYLKKEIER